MVPACIDVLIEPSRPLLIAEAVATIEAVVTSRTAR
jgi:hypothetical protein